MSNLNIHNIRIDSDLLDQIHNNTNPLLLKDLSYYDETNLERDDIIEKHIIHYFQNRKVVNYSLNGEKFSETTY